MGTNIRTNLSYYLQNPKSSEARAFFEGARSMITALQLAPASEYPNILSTSNQQHIIALLVQSDEQQRTRRRKDAQQMLKLYDVDKMSFLAFIFDLPKINMLGQAIDENGDPLEDKMFRPLPGKTHDGWPDRKIRHLHTEQEITRSEYLALDESKRWEYDYCRYFNLSLNGKPSYRISSSDRYIMEELIRQSILINDPEINNRYLTEIHYDAETDTVGRLYDYRNVIISTFDELREAASPAKIVPMIDSQVKQGYIKSAGHLLIAQLQWLATRAKHLDLLHFRPCEIRTWAELIRACRTSDSKKLTELVTVDDIAGYQNLNGCPLPGAIYNADNKEHPWQIEAYYENMPAWKQKDFFQHILVNVRVCNHLSVMLSQIMTREDLDAADCNPGIMEALQELADALSNGNDAQINKP